MKTNHGHLSLDDNAEPVQLDSIFQYSSSTKIVTAVAALQCVERGLIGLDGSTADHLPELSDQQLIYLENQTGQEPRVAFKPRSNPITLRHLLTHTSGLGMEHMDPRLQAWRQSRGEMMQAFSGNAIDSFSIPLLYEPGEGWSYGASFEAVGVLVSRLSGVSLEEYMQKNIFAPLGLRSSTFMPEDVPSLHQRLVQCVTRTPEGGLIPWEHATDKNPTVPQGGGGLFTTAVDHHAILADLVSHQPKLLKPATIELLFSPQLTPGSAAMADFEASRPLLNSMLGSLIADVKIKYCFGGVLIAQDSPGLGKTTGTVTWAGGLGSFWMLNREHKLAASFAAQIFPIMDSKCLELIAAFVQEVWRQLD